MVHFWNITDPDKDNLYGNLHIKNYLFVCFDSLGPSQQVFSRVGTGLPGLNQY